METGKEYIVCAAVWYEDIESTFPIERLPSNIRKGIVVCGYRHPQCMWTFASLTNKSMAETGRTIAGFLTSKNRFVNRKQAAKIALEAGQITKAPEALYSEDIY